MTSTYFGVTIELRRKTSLAQMAQFMKTSDACKCNVSFASRQLSSCVSDDDDDERVSEKQKRKTGFGGQ